MTAPSKHTDYTVGIVCALPIELAAAAEMLDEEFPDLQPLPGDDNLYNLGRIGPHNVVITALPAGRTGNNAATAAAMQLRESFKSIRFGLMVGIAGGVPTVEDIRLGDVVVSQPKDGHGGVIQHDFVKFKPDEVKATGFLNMPPNLLLNAVTRLRALHDRGRGGFEEYLEHITSRLPKFSRERAGPDVLYSGDCSHDLSAACKTCEINVVERENRPDEVPEIHYGNIASGNVLMRYGKERDAISKTFGGVLCFEMEAAGLMNDFKCLVIRGICDYADSHKNKKWQPYASAAAAAYAKDLLMQIPAAEVIQESSVEDKPDTRQSVHNTANFGPNNSGAQIHTNNGPLTMSFGRQ